MKLIFGPKPTTVSRTKRKMFAAYDINTDLDQWLEKTREAIKSYSYITDEDYDKVRNWIVGEILNPWSKIHGNYDLNERRQDELAEMLSIVMEMRLKNSK